MSDLTTMLQQDLTAAQIELSADTQTKLIDFIMLLQKWNKTHNLTAIRDPEQMLTKHLLDSLVIKPFINTRNNLDVGTGGGIPGIPLALASPEQQWTLLDSNSKKLAFVTYACGSLSIKNITVVDERVENYHPAQPFDTIITRAFSDVPDIIDKTQHLLSKEGILMAMKGQNPQQELENIPGFVKVHAIQVPRLDEPRHLVCIKGISCE